MKKMETDIIVAAAGLSGLAAAISAAENGARVLVFEKSGTTGGAANMGMGPLGVGSRIQREHMISLTPGRHSASTCISPTIVWMPGWSATITLNQEIPLTG